LKGEAILSESQSKSQVDAERLFDRNQRREIAISDALNREAVRRAAALENMHRLRELRLARDAKLNRK
jgi:hypothetical protein